MKARRVIEQIPARASSDGDGVKLLRVFGGRQPERFDPFLLLDEFGSDEAADYIGGFPPHPHRGFETVTYMLQGKMEHRDHLNNVGLIEDGDVQWMTAGRGIIHSEMPKQTEGRMRGFQLWVNLPAQQKMQAARYQDIPGEAIPVVDRGALRIKAIAGEAIIDGQTITGYIDAPHSRAVYMDIHLQSQAQTHISVDPAFNVLVYVYQGSALIGSDKTTTKPQTLARLSDEGELVIANEDASELRLLLLAGKPIGEPIVQHGPFVMNSVAEIETAIRDYQSGTLTAAT